MNIKAAALAATIAAVTLTACSSMPSMPADTAPPAAPAAPAPAPAPAPQSADEQITDAQALEFIDSVCTILDNYGITAGVPVMFDVARESGVDEVAASALLATAVKVGCPEYEAAILEEAAR